MKKKQIVITPPDSFSVADKTRLERNGFLVVECKNYSQVRLLTDVEFMDENSITLSLLEALANSNGISEAKEKFIKGMYTRLSKKWQQQSDGGNNLNTIK